MELVFFVCIFLINLIFFLNLQKISKAVNLYDKPDNKRKIHSFKVSLLGGTVFLISIFAYFFFDFFYLNIHSNINIYYLLISLFFIYLTGLIDDKYDIGPNLKIFIFLLIFSFLLFFENNFIITTLRFSFLGEQVNLGRFSFFFTILCLILFTNAFNMFDGMNGQSGFYTLIIFIFFILNNMYLNLSLVILICCVFFIFFNLKNKIFLGDNGSLLLSLLISLLIINTYNERNDFFCDEIFILMMIPGFDLIRLFFIRISKKKIQ